MKIYLTIILSYVLSLAPISALPAFAAYNDVELTTTAEITISSVTLTISGGSAFMEQIAVDSESFTVTMPANSYIKVSSADKRTISATELGSITRVFSCGADASTLEVANPAQGESVTPTFTVSSSACVGGGGGGGSAPSVPVQTGILPSSTTPAPSVASPSPIALAVSPVFNSNLSLGARNDDVKKVQQLLNSDSDTKVAESGAGSPGNETSYFGPATRNALGKFQIKYGVVSSSSEAGYGNLGPKTRAKLAEVFASGVPGASVAPAVAQPSPVAVSVSPVFSSALGLGTSNADVKRLQQLLNSDSDTAIAASGVGSAGSETNYYGSLTAAAVAKFQLKHGVVSSASDPGYGFVGPKTRAKLGEVFGGTTLPTTAPSSVGTPTESVGDAPATPAPVSSPAPSDVPFWLQLTPVTPGSASIVYPFAVPGQIAPIVPDQSAPVSEPSSAVAPVPQGDSSELPFWMQMTSSN